MTSVEDILSYLKDDGTLTSKNFIQSLLFGEESDDLNDLKSSFNTKFVKPLLERVKNLDKEEIKKITDPLGLSELSDKDFTNNLS
jgi:hypothetical protein